MINLLSLEFSQEDTIRCFRFLNINERTMNNFLLLDQDNLITTNEFRNLNDSERNLENFSRLRDNQKTIDNLLSLNLNILEISGYFGLLNIYHRTINSLREFPRECWLKLFSQLIVADLTMINLLSLKLSQEDTARCFKHLREDERTIINLSRLSREKPSSQIPSPRAIAFEFLREEDQKIEYLYTDIYGVQESERKHCLQRFGDICKAFTSPDIFRYSGNPHRNDFSENFYSLLSYLDSDLQIEFIKNINGNTEQYITLELLLFLERKELESEENRYSESDTFPVADNIRAEFYFELAKKFCYEYLSHSSGQQQEREDQEKEDAVKIVSLLEDSMTRYGLFSKPGRKQARDEFLKRVSMCSAVAKKLLHNQDTDGFLKLNSECRVVIAYSVKPNEVTKDWLYYTTNDKRQISHFDFLDIETREQIEKLLCAKLKIGEIDGYWFLEYCHDDKNIQWLLLRKMFEYCLMTGQMPVLYKPTLNKFDKNSRFRLALVQSMSATVNVSLFSPKYFSNSYVQDNIELYMLTLCIRERLFCFKVFSESDNREFQLAMFSRLYFVNPSPNPIVVKNAIEKIKFISVLSFFINFNHVSELIVGGNPDYPQLKNQKISNDIIILLRKRRLVLTLCSKNPALCLMLNVDQISEYHRRNVVEVIVETEKISRFTRCLTSQRELDFDELNRIIEDITQIKTIEHLISLKDLEVYFEDRDQYQIILQHLETKLNELKIEPPNRLVSEDADLSEVSEGSIARSYRGDDLL
jgi:hypothetical protein